VTLSRDKALEVFDACVRLGFAAVLVARDMTPHGHVTHDEQGRITSVTYRVEIAELTVTKDRMRTLIELADDLGVEFSSSQVEQGRLAFSGADHAVVMKP
jgi:hypothetical protein